MMLSISNQIIIDSMRYSEAARIQLYGTDLYEKYQGLYGSDMNITYEDILRDGTIQALEKYRQRGKFRKFRIFRNIYLDKALIDACKYGNVRLIKSLIRRGAYPKAEDNLPIIRACGALRWRDSDTDLGLVQYLVEDCGADPRARNDRPLVIASFTSSPKGDDTPFKIIQYLVEECGANPRAYMIRPSKSAVNLARLEGHLDVADYLAKVKPRNLDNIPKSQKFI